MLNNVVNQTIRELYDRKSVRVFADKRISPEARTAILQSAFMAPTAGDQQMYTILEITDPERKEKLAVSCDNQPFIAKAEMVLIFLADCSKWHRAFEDAGCEPRDPGVGDFALAMCDAVIAAQNAVVAAQSLGIGSCYIGDIMERYEYHRDLLKLPPYVFPAAMLVFGYPTEQQIRRQKPPRAPEDCIVFQNEYPQSTAEDLERLMRTYAAGRDYSEWIAAFCKRKYNSDFSREMSRSVAAFIESISEKKEK